jgi:alkylation response protein AidB-like acyl-CoA dehydrogenase
MDFQRTEEQELLMESVRDFVTRNYPEEYFRTCDEQGKYPQEFMKGLVDAGLGLLGLPEEWGGTPVDYLTLCMFCEEVARRTGCPYLTSYIIYTDDILQFGTEEQKKTIMGLVSAGKPSLSLGISEPQAGSDNSGMTCTATKRDGKYYINGQKTFVSNGHISPYSLLFTRDLAGPKPQKAMTMWMLPMDKKGVKTNVLHKVGWKMRPFCEIYLEDVELEEKDIIGKENQGFFQLMKNFEIERLVIVAGCLGCAQAAFDDAIVYARQREQFGQPIGNFQITQLKLTDMAIKLENMRNMLYKCAWEKGQGRDVRITSALAKRYIAMAAFEVVDDAMQIMGTIGYTDDSRISRMWRDLRGNRIDGGTDEIMVYIAGRALLKEYMPK